jgi:predicted metal-dependent peptidase
LLYKECKSKSGGKPGVPNNGGRSGAPGQSFDQHLNPGNGRGMQPTEAEAERNPQQWVNAIRAAMESARRAGNLPANLERMFCAGMEVKTDWRELTALAISKSIGRDGHSWQYLDNEMALRGIGFPSRVKFGCDHVVVVGDSSGSVDQKTMDMFMANLQAIIEQAKPKRTTFVQCDATIHSWEDIDDIADLNGKVRGGGGTNFCPPFERLKDEGDVPDVLIYLTDLEGPMPDQPPPYPVVWGCINQKKAPWGTTIHIPPMASDAELASYQ